MVLPTSLAFSVLADEDDLLQTESWVDE